MFRIDFTNEDFCEIRDAVFTGIYIPWEEIPELSEKLIIAKEKHNKLKLKKAEKLLKKSAIQPKIDSVHHQPKT